jgi:hypothetical protein
MLVMTGLGNIVMMGDRDVVFMKSGLLKKTVMKERPNKDSLLTLNVNSVSDTTAPDTDFTLLLARDCQM